MKSQRIAKFLKHTLLNTLMRLNPVHQIEIPVLFVFYAAAMGLTLFSIYMAIVHDFSRVPFESLTILWILVVFSNLCESIMKK